MLYQINIEPDPLAVPNVPLNCNRSFIRRISMICGVTSMQMSMITLISPPLESPITCSSLITNLSYRPNTPLLMLLHGLTMLQSPLVYRTTSKLSGKSPWCLNYFLLGSPDIVSEVQSQLSKLFSLNKGSVSSPDTLWYAHKACMREKVEAEYSCGSFKSVDNSRFFN